MNIDSRFWWLLFGLTILIPGLFEVYSAWKLRKFLKLSGSIMPFIFSLSNGVWDSLISVLIVILAFFGLLVIKLRFDNIWIDLLIFTVIFLYLTSKFSSSILAMFLSGLLDESSVRRVLEKINNMIENIKNNGYDLLEKIFNKFIKRDKNE